MRSTRPYLLRAFHEWITDNGCTPFLLVDAGVDDVQVPADYVVDGKIVLNIGAAAVRDLEIDEGFVTFSARFGGSSHGVRVPVDAIRAIYARENGKGLVFGDDELDLGPSEPSPGGHSDRPKLRIVK
jgi:stringent starvation protein B